MKQAHHLKPTHAHRRTATEERPWKGQQNNMHTYVWSTLGSLGWSVKHHCETYIIKNKQKSSTAIWKKNIRKPQTRIFRHPHYENAPIQIYRQFHLQKPGKNPMKNWFFSYFCSKHRLWYSLEPPRIYNGWLYGLPCKKDPYHNTTNEGPAQPALFSSLTSVFITCLQNHTQNTSSKREGVHQTDLVLTGDSIPYRLI